MAEEEQLEEEQQDLQQQEVQSTLDKAVEKHLELVGKNQAEDELLRSFREAFEKESFDVLIFDSESDPGCPVSLRELCRLPEDVLIYVRGKNLLGRDEKSRHNLCYSRSCFTECAEELVEYFLSSRVVESGIFDFRHIITEFEPTQNSGPDGK